MKRSTFLFIAAILAVLIGGLSLIFPAKMAESFGVTSTPMIIFLARELGVFNLCTGALNFLVRNDQDSKTLKAILIFNFAYHLMMLPINLYALSQGVFTLAQALPPMAFHLVLGIGSYVYLSKIKTSRH